MAHRTIAIPSPERSGLVARFLAMALVALAILAVAKVDGARAQGLFGGSDDGDRRAAELSLRINQLETQMRGLTGQIEQLSFQIRQMQDAMTRMQKDYEFRLQELESSGTRSGARVAPQKKSEVSSPDGEGGSLATAGLPRATRTAPGAPPAPLGQLSGSDPIGGLIGSAPMNLGAPGVAAQPIGGPEMAPVPGVDPRYSAAQPTPNAGDEYESAYGYVLNGEYELAETSFKTFIANHPTDKRVGSAQFWLGESYYVRARNKEAADAFLKSYTQFPDGPKAPDSLLKLGLSLSGLGEKKAACATYDELVAKYPKASKALRDRAMAEKSRAKC